MTATNYEVNSGVGGGGPGGSSAISSIHLGHHVGAGAATAVNPLVPASGAGQPAVTESFISPSSPSSSSYTSKNSGGADTTFEPTVDMMVNDFDDEQTLEEEEALAAREAEDPSAELSNLQKESDMPIEELLALYNCAGSGGSAPAAETVVVARTGAAATATAQSNPQRKTGNNVAAPGSKLSRRMASTSSGKDESNETTAPSVEEPTEEEEYDDEDEEEEEEDEDDQKEASQLRKLYPETYGANDKRLLRAVSRQQSDEEDDGDYSPDEDEFKKTIMVGSEFQAVIPEGFVKYDDVLPYENEDKLMWDPMQIDENKTVEYLQSANQAKQSNGNFAGIDSIPIGSHLRDDEQALYLLQQCGHITDEALRRKRINATPSSKQMSIWSEDECRNFESGIRIYGKDFHTIQHTKVRTRSVGELVQFYYLWKKTERHDIFANKSRLEKKKYSLHPGLTDYMDRFLEEQEGGAGSTATATTTTTATNPNASSMTLRDRSSSPIHSATASVNYLIQADNKRSSSGSSHKHDSFHTVSGKLNQLHPRDPLAIDDDDLIEHHTTSLRTKILTQDSLTKIVNSSATGGDLLRHAVTQ